MSEYFSKKHRKIYQDDKETDPPAKNDDCVICLEKLLQGDANNPLQWIKLVDCKHYFHLACIASWFTRSKSCPYCRNKLVVEASSEAWEHQLLEMRHYMDDRLSDNSRENFYLWFDERVVNCIRER